MNLWRWVANKIETRPPSAREYRKMPELHLFTTADEAGRALAQSASSVWPYVAVVAMAAVPILLWTAADRKTLFGVPIAHYRAVLDILIYVAIALVATEITSIVLVKQTRQKLRHRLIELGIPVCLYCGYDLRGGGKGVCPECGR